MGAGGHGHSHGAGGGCCGGPTEHLQHGTVFMTRNSALTERQKQDILQNKHVYLSADLTGRSIQHIHYYSTTASATSKSFSAHFTELRSRTKNRGIVATAELVPVEAKKATLVYHDSQASRDLSFGAENHPLTEEASYPITDPVILSILDELITPRMPVKSNALITIGAAIELMTGFISDGYWFATIFDLASGFSGAILPFGYSLPISWWALGFGAGLACLSAIGSAYCHWVLNLVNQLPQYQYAASQSLRVSTSNHSDEIQHRHSHSHGHHRGHGHSHHHAHQHANTPCYLDDQSAIDEEQGRQDELSPLVSDTAPSARSQPGVPAKQSHHHHATTQTFFSKFKQLSAAQKLSSAGDLLSHMGEVAGPIVFVTMLVTNNSLSRWGQFGIQLAGALLGFIGSAANTITCIEAMVKYNAVEQAARCKKFL